MPRRVALALALRCFAMSLRVRPLIMTGSSTWMDARVPKEARFFMCRKWHVPDAHICTSLASGRPGVCSRRPIKAHLVLRCFAPGGGARGVATKATKARACGVGDAEHGQGRHGHRRRRRRLPAARFGLPCVPPRVPQRR